MNLPEERNHLQVLLIGCGVIGSIYGGQLALAGHHVWVLDHGEREKDITQNGIRLYNIDSNKHETAKVLLAKNATEREYDLVIVAVNAHQLHSTFSTLRSLKSSPHTIFFGNNPEGHSLLPHDIPGTVALAFPGVAGSIKENIVHYVHIPQQPTTLEATRSPVGKMFETTLKKRGFPIYKTNEMDGWLAYHAVFISCISMAIIRANNNITLLGSNKKLLSLMCRALEEGFRIVKIAHKKGLPKNLAILHSPLLRPFAIAYWGNMMRSPKGERYFASHVRHAPEEIYTLAEWIIKQCPKDTSKIPHLIDLLRVEKIPSNKVG